MQPLSVQVLGGPLQPLRVFGVHQAPSPASDSLHSQWGGPKAETVGGISDTGL